MGALQHRKPWYCAACLSLNVRFLAAALAALPAGCSLFLSLRYFPMATSKNGRKTKFGHRRKMHTTYVKHNGNMMLRSYLRAPPDTLSEETNANPYGNACVRANVSSLANIVYRHLSNIFTSPLICPSCFLLPGWLHSAAVRISLVIPSGRSSGLDETCKKR